MDKPHLQLVWNNQDAESFVTWMETTQDDYLSVDSETTGLDVWHDRIRMVQFGDRKFGWAIPYETPDGGIDEHAWHLVEHALTYFADNGRPLSAHRKKFDALFLHNAGHTVDGITEDGKASAHLINSTRSGLKEAAAHAFGAWAAEGERELKDLMKRKKWTYGTVPVDTREYWYYAALDPVLESRLQAHNMPTIQSQYAELYQMELEVSDALQQAEITGMGVDLDYCAEQWLVLDKLVEECEQDWREAGVNPKSTKQLAPLFEEAGFTVPRKPPTAKMLEKDPNAIGNYSIDDKWLDKQPPGHPLVDRLQELRNLYKQRDTYFGPYLELAIDHGGEHRIHTFIETLGARTGRMSSRNPNLQNVPKREAGDYIRRAFTARPGCVLILADFEQIEYRIFASAAGEPDMIQAILDGKDLHAVTAQMVYNDPSITKADKRRDNAKNGNFAEIYMAGLEKFADTAHITLPEAAAFKKAYHKAFPRVKPFSKSVMNYARSNGLAIVTRFGRYVPVDATAIYAALNYLIQGSAADVLKRAIQKLARTEWIQYLRLPVHDELIFEVPIELADRLEAELPEIMEDRETFKVPLEISISRAYRWGETLQKEAA